MNMNILSGKWIGDLRGTIYANAFAEVRSENGKATIELRVNAPGKPLILCGPIQMDVDGKVSGTLKPTQTPEHLNGDMVATITFSSISEDRLEAEWGLDDGNAGLLALVRFNTQDASHSNLAPASPIQQIHKTRQLPKITLYRDQIKELVEILKSSIETPFEVVIAVNSDRKGLKRLASNFWDTPNLPAEAQSLSLSISEPGEGVTRQITINVSEEDSSFNVVGRDEIWVSGTTIEIEEALRSKSSRVRWLYEKHGLSINSIAFLTTLALLPDLSIGQRFILIGITIILALGLKKLHDSTTAVRIFLKKDYKEASYIDVPRLATTLAGAAILALIGGTYRLLTDGSAQRVVEWLVSN